MNASSQTYHDVTMDQKNNISESFVGQTSPIQDSNTELERIEKYALETLDIHSYEISRLVNENKALRLNVTTYLSELNILNNAEYASQEKIQQLSTKLQNAQTQLLQNELELKKAEKCKSDHISENERLRNLGNHLMNEIHDLRETIHLHDSLGAMQLASRIHHFEKQRENPSNPPDNMNHTDALLSKQYDLQPESDRLELEKTIQRQKEDILHSTLIVDALHREKISHAPALLLVGGLSFPYSSYNGQAPPEISSDSLNYFKKNNEEPSQLETTSQENRSDECQIKRSYASAGVSSKKEAPFMSKQHTTTHLYRFPYPVNHTVARGCKKHNHNKRSHRKSTQRSLSFGDGCMIIDSIPKLNLDSHEFHAKNVDVTVNFTDYTISFVRRSSATLDTVSHILQFEDAESMEKCCEELFKARFMSTKTPVENNTMSNTISCLPYVPLDLHIDLPLMQGVNGDRELSGLCFPSSGYDTIHVSLEDPYKSNTNFKYFTPPPERTAKSTDEYKIHHDTRGQNHSLSRFHHSTEPMNFNNIPRHTKSSHFYNDTTELRSSPRPSHHNRTNCPAKTTQCQHMFFPYPSIMYPLKDKEDSSVDEQALPPDSSVVLAKHPQGRSTLHPPNDPNNKRELLVPQRPYVEKAIQSYRNPRNYSHEKVQRYGKNFPSGSFLPSQGHSTKNSNMTINKNFYIHTTPKLDNSIVPSLSFINSSSSSQSTFEYIKKNERIHQLHKNNVLVENPLNKGYDELVGNAETPLGEYHSSNSSPKQWSLNYLSGVKKSTTPEGSDDESSTVYQGHKKPMPASHLEGYHILEPSSKHLTTHVCLLPNRPNTQIRAFEICSPGKLVENEFYYSVVDKKKPKKSTAHLSHILRKQKLSSIDLNDNNWISGIHKRLKTDKRIHLRDNESYDSLSQKEERKKRKGRTSRFDLSDFDTDNSSYSPREVRANLWPARHIRERFSFVSESEGSTLEDNHSRDSNKESWSSESSLSSDLSYEYKHPKSTDSTGEGGQKISLFEEPRFLGESNKKCGKKRVKPTHRLSEKVIHVKDEREQNASDLSSESSEREESAEDLQEDVKGKQKPKSSALFTRQRQHQTSIWKHSSTSTTSNCSVSESNSVSDDEKNSKSRPTRRSRGVHPTNSGYDSSDSVESVRFYEAQLTPKEPSGAVPLGRVHHHTTSSKHPSLLKESSDSSLQEVSQNHKQNTKSRKLKKKPVQHEVVSDSKEPDKPLHHKTTTQPKPLTSGRHTQKLTLIALEPTSVAEAKHATHGSNPHFKKKHHKSLEVSKTIRSRFPPEALNESTSSCKSLTTSGSSNSFSFQHLSHSMRHIHKKSPVVDAASRLHGLKKHHGEISPPATEKQRLSSSKKKVEKGNPVILVNHPSSNDSLSPSSDERKFDDSSSMGRLSSVDSYEKKSPRFANKKKKRKKKMNKLKHQQKFEDSSFSDTDGTLSSYGTSSETSSEGYRRLPKSEKKSLLKKGSRHFPRNPSHRKKDADLVKDSPKIISPTPNTDRRKARKHRSSSRTSLKESSHNSALKYSSLSEGSSPQQFTTSEESSEYSRGVENKARDRRSRSRNKLQRLSPSTTYSDKSSSSEDVTRPHKERRQALKVSRGRVDADASDRFNDVTSSSESLSHKNLSDDDKRSLFTFVFIFDGLNLAASGLKNSERNGTNQEETELGTKSKYSEHSIYPSSERSVEPLSNVCADHSTSVPSCGTSMCTATRRNLTANVGESEPLAILFNVPTIFDPKTNTVSFELNDKEHELPDLRGETTHIVVDAQKEKFYLESEDPNQLKRGLEIGLRSNTNRDFKELLDNALKMRWKSLNFTPIPEHETKTLDVPLNESPVLQIENNKIRVIDKDRPENSSLVFDTNDVTVVTNDENNEVKFTKNYETGDEENYVFKFNKEDYETKKKNLFDGGVKITEENLKTAENKNMADREMCIVEKGLLKMYKHYGTASDKPVITLTPDIVSATADEKRKEIILTRKLPNGEEDTKLIDCFSNNVYARWHTALLFGGFIKDITPEEENELKFLNNLTRYIFPIRFLNFKEQEENPCIRVDSQGIKIFSHPDDETPFFIFEKKLIEVFLEPMKRRFRIYRSRYTPREDTCDIIVTLSRSYDHIKSELEKYELLTNNSIPILRSKKESRKMVVRSRRLKLSFFKSRRHQHTEITLSAFDYLGEIREIPKKYEIILRPRNDDEELNTCMAKEEAQHRTSFTSPEERLALPTYVFSVDNIYEKRQWQFAFFVSGCDKDIKDPPSFFLPYFFYEFFTEDFPLFGKNTPLQRLNILNRIRSSRWFPSGKSSTVKSSGKKKVTQAKKTSDNVLSGTSQPSKSPPHTVPSGNNAKPSRDKPFFVAAKRPLTVSPNLQHHSTRQD